jgi:hypothetical protein
MKPFLLALTFVGLAFSTLVSGQGGDRDYGKPKRLNKMIELLGSGQPVYDVGVTGGGYEEGKKLAQTTNDLIQYEMGLEYLKKGGSDEAHAGTGGLTPEGCHESVSPSWTRHARASWRP